MQECKGIHFRGEAEEAYYLEAVVAAEVDPCLGQVGEVEEEVEGEVSLEALKQQLISDIQTR